MPNDHMHWTGKAWLKKASANLSPPVMWVLDYKKEKVVGNKITNKWLADAAKLDLSTFDIGKYIAKTSRVSDFIDGGRFIVSAPKGYGKTLLLKYVYQQLPKQPGNIHIPSNTPIDSFDYGIPFDEKKLDYLSETQNWDLLWQVSIGLSVILNYAMGSHDDDYYLSFLDRLTKKNNKLDSILHVCKEIKIRLDKNIGIPRYIKVQANPSSILSLLIASSLSALLHSLDWTLGCIHQYFLGVDRPVSVFIDQVDQGTREYPCKIWKAAQGGLVASIFRLHSSNRHVKIFSSIRKEAWDSCQDELVSQFEDYVCDLSYTESELREIFVHAIKTFEDENTVRVKSKYYSSPIEAFIGQDHIKNNWGGTEEDPFKYMCRHTLRRPRDLILFGKEIHALIQHDNFDKKSFVELVNRIPGIEIHKQYLKEAAPFTRSIKYINTDLFFEKLTKNVYTENELINICANFNRDNVCIAKKGGSCRDCLGASNIFCDLYRIGLLGIVVRKEPQGEDLCQHFEIPGVVNSMHLPKSRYYLLHPAMDYYIKEIQNNYEFTPVKGIVVGNGHDWNDKYDAYLLLVNIDEWLRSSGITPGSTIYKSFDDLYSSLIFKKDAKVVEEKINKVKNIVTSDGLLSSSQFIANITSATDTLSKMLGLI